MKQFLILLLIPIGCFCQIESDKIVKFTKARTVSTKLVNISKTKTILYVGCNFRHQEIKYNDERYINRDLYENQYSVRIGFLSPYTDYLNEGQVITLLDTNGDPHKFYTNEKIQLKIKSDAAIISFNVKPKDFLDYLFTDIRILTDNYKIDFEIDEKKLFLELNQLYKYINK